MDILAATAEDLYGSAGGGTVVMDRTTITLWDSYIQVRITTTVTVGIAYTDRAAVITVEDAIVSGDFTVGGALIISTAITSMIGGAIVATSPSTSTSPATPTAAPATPTTATPTVYLAATTTLSFTFGKTRVMSPTPAATPGVPAGTTTGAQANTLTATTTTPVHGVTPPAADAKTTTGVLTAGNASAQPTSWLIKLSATADSHLIAATVRLATTSASPHAPGTSTSDSAKAPPPHQPTTGHIITLTATYAKPTSAISVTATASPVAINTTTHAAPAPQGFSNGNNTPPPAAITVPRAITPPEEK